MEGLLKPSTKANTGLLRQLNKSRVLGLIKKETDLSRYDIAKRMRISPTTVSLAVEELIRSNLVIESVRRNTVAGRKPGNLRHNPDAGYVVGVTIESPITGVRMNLDGELLQQEKAEFKIGDSLAFGLSQTSLVLNRLIQPTMGNGNKVLMIGMGVTGFVDPEKGIGMFSPPFGWKDVPYREHFEDKFGIPVYVDNHERQAAIAEKIFGAAKGSHSLLYIRVENGVGGAIVLDDKVYRGKHFFAGEIGHTVVLDGGPKCRCGNTGCIEALFYNEVLAEQARAKAMNKDRLNQSGLKAVDILRIAEGGDEGVKDVLADAAGYLARMIANLINAFDPEVVVLKGSLFEEGELFFRLVKEGIFRDVFKMMARRLRIEKAQIGELGGAMGAGAFVLEKLHGFPSRLLESNAS